MEKRFEEDLLRKEEEREERERIAEELDEELEREMDSTTVEHYVHNWYVAIKNYSTYRYHKEEMEKYKSLFEKRAEKIRSQYEQNPAIEDDWLEIYERRLRLRDEGDTFDLLKTGHAKLREKIIPATKYSSLNHDPSDPSIE